MKYYDSRVIILTFRKHILVGTYKCWYSLKPKPEPKQKYLIFKKPGPNWNRKEHKGSKLWLKVYI